MKRNTVNIFQLLAALLLLVSLLVFSVPVSAAYLAEYQVPDSYSETVAAYDLELINPLYPTEEIVGIWGSGPNDVFVLDSGANVYHYNGTAWDETQITADFPGMAIWGFSSTDVYVTVGAIMTGTPLYHFDGATWTPVTGPSNMVPATLIWGSSPSDLYLGSGIGTGVYQHYDGSTWSMNSTGIGSGSLTSMWGSSASDVYALTVNGEIAHYDGTAWSLAYNDYSFAPLMAVWGSSSTDVYAVGALGKIVHYNGVWNIFPSPTSGSLLDVWGSSSSNIYAVGSDSTVIRYNGIEWTSVTVPVTAELRCVWGSGPDDVYIGGHDGVSSVLLHWDGFVWSSLLGSNLTGDNLESIRGSGTGSVYAVGRDGVVLNYNGATWSSLTTPADYLINGVYHSGTVVCAAGTNGHILYYDGASWSEVMSNTTQSLNGIWGSAANDIYFVGSSGLIFNYNGSTLTTMTSGTTTTLRGVHGTSASDIWAVGNSGTIRHYDGSTWAAQTSGISKSLYKVWAADAANAWAVGASGNILHYDGTGWASQTSPVTSTIYDVYGTSPEDVFAAGDGGIILHYDGVVWTQIASGTIEDINGVWCDGAGTAWFVGDSGTILKCTYTMPQSNTPPVAEDQSVKVPYSLETPVTLTATDIDEDSLSYTIVDGPLHGDLGGSAPDVTYTPYTGYTGADSFTFQAFDGSNYSNTATVSIVVDPSSSYAAQVVDYSGSFGGGTYGDPEALLGKPSTMCMNMGFPSSDPFHVKLVEAAYNTDLEGQPVITTINSGYITVKFDHQVMNDPDNPYGTDFLVFGNAFFTGTGGFVGDDTDMSAYMLSNPAGCFSETVNVAVSQDGVTWYEFASGPYADGMFPTHAYEWDQSLYDSTANGWTDNEMDFTKPVNPSLSLSDFDGISAAAAIALYEGSGGGTGFDLDEVGLNWIQYVKVTSSGGEIDAFADVCEVLPYTYTIDNGEVTITGYTGPGGDVVIPDTIEGLPVRVIGESAFDGCSALTSVTIPSSVTSIDEYAFYGCTALTAIDVDASNSVYASVDGVLYDDAITTLVQCPAGKTSVTIPDGVTSIGINAFLSCISLTSVTIPGSVTSIGDCAFYECTALASVTVPDSVNSIGAEAFSSCSALSSVTLSNNLTVIANATFIGCIHLTSVTIPDSVTSIEYAAFSDCYGLTSVTIGNGVTSIGGSAFKNCTDLISVVLPGGVTSIGNYGFSGCTSLASMTFNGNAPTVGINWAKNVPATMIVCYQTGATGFTNPWEGFTTVMLGSTTPWDVNGDSTTNYLDMILVGNHYGESGSPGWIPEDVNGDGTVNYLDMILIGNHYGE